MNTEIEVRCCCTPQKLMGWMAVDPHYVTEGCRITFPLHHPGGLPGEPFAHLRLETVALEVARMYTPERGEYLALKSEDIPVETLRRAGSFREAQTVSAK